MKLLKPDWVSHDGKPIFSIDIHPDGSRVATGGQGDDSGKVVIWNMAPIREEKEEEDEDVPKVLCQMDSHLACVNCVRWSESGKFLASGGDDKLVMIWQISRGFGSGKAFGSNVTIVEHWRSVATLRGHSGDVLDLSWSSQDVWLASCSVDNTIVIWGTLKFEQQKVLKGHSGLVKGVTWDPVGKYLASQSDDKTLRVWRTADWKEETVVSSCFKECGGTTHVLRLNWSPDGNHIVSAHAMNNCGPTAQIVERNGWGTSLDFVGHRKAITVVRFNPKILSKPKKGSDKKQQYSCCAIGSKDRSVSVWLTALKRPLVVMHDMFEKSVLDISWSRTGLELLCCSIDGTVAYMGFDETEIGAPMPKVEQQSVLEKMYGKSVLMSKQANAPCPIIESAAVLNLQQQQQGKDREASLSILSTPSKSMSALLPNGDMPFKPRDKQIETRTSDGRRRITPIFLAPQPDMNEMGIPTPFTTKSIAFNTSKGTSKIVIEKQDRVTLPGLNVSSNSSHSLQSPPLPSVTTPTGGGGEEEGKGGGGDRGEASVHTPMEVDPPALPLPSTPTTTADKGKAASESAAPEKPSATPLAPQDKEREKDKEAAASESARESENEKKKEKESEKGEKDRNKHRLSGALSLRKSKVGRGRPRKIDREAVMTAVSTPPVTPVVSVEPESVRPVVASQDLQLPVPAVEKTTSKVVGGQSGAEDCVNLEVENSIAAGGGSLHQCRRLKGGVLLWTQIFSSQIIAVAGSRHISCVACEDKTAHILDAGGRRLLPPLMLGSRVSTLQCTEHHVMALTAHGFLHVWDMSVGKALIQSQSLSPIMSGGERVTHTILTKQGVPLLTISSGKSFCFAPEIGTWMLVSSREDRLQLCSDHQRCLPSRLKSSGPLATVQAALRGPQQARGVFQTSGSLQQTSTVSHLESQLATCLALKSPSEYRFWLETYVRYLVQEGQEDKLRGVCDDLLGPIFSRSAGDSVWQHTILGVKKREILRRILPLIGANLQWQRLYTEYQEQLEAISPDT